MLWFCWFLWFRTCLSFSLSLCFFIHFVIVRRRNKKSSIFFLKVFRFNDSVISIGFSFCVWVHLWNKSFIIRYILLHIYLFFFRSIKKTYNILRLPPVILTDIMYSPFRTHPSKCITFLYTFIPSIWRFSASAYILAFTFHFNLTRSASNIYDKLWNYRE